MRALVQRVLEASVEVAGEVVGRTGPGLVVLLGVSRNDTEDEARYIVGKTADLRIFNDEDGKFYFSARDTGAELLVVSQFTLYGDTQKGEGRALSMLPAPSLRCSYTTALCSASGTRASRWPPGPSRPT